MDKAFAFLEKRLMGPLSKVANTRIIRALMNAGLATVPFTIVSSIFLLINNLPMIIPPLGEFFQNTILNYSDLYSVGNTMALGSIAIYYVLAFAYYLTTEYKEEVHKMDQFTGTILALYAFLMTVVQVRFEDGKAVLVADETDTSIIYKGIGLGNWVTRFGGTGIFIGIVVTFLAIRLYRWCVEKNVTIKMPAGVPAGVSRAFASLLPAIFIAFMMIAINGVLAIFGTDIHGLLSKPFAFVQQLTGSLGGMIVIMLLVHLLWIIGVHGTSIVVNSFVNPILLVALTENMEGGTNIFAGDFKNMFVFIGGAGATLGLVICMLIWAKSAQLKTLSRAGALPSLFNINEPIIFGAPIVYNPYLAIPFVVVPLITTCTTYFAISWGLVDRIVAAIPWISPVGVGGFLGTGGGFTAVLLALLNLAISIVCYFPFMRMYDSKLYAQEQEMAQQEEAEAKAVKAD